MSSEPAIELGVRNRTPQTLNRSDIENVFGSPDAPRSDPSVLITNERQRSDALPSRNRGDLNTQDPLRLPQSGALLETDANGQKPPLAGPEIDDMDEKPANAAPYPGIDDGLLDTNNKTPYTPTEEGNGHGLHGSSVGEWDEEGKLLHTGTKNGVDTTDSYYYTGGLYPNGITNRAGEVPGMVSPGSGTFTIIPDVNQYQQKKNLAQGMMDLALLSANANQLRYVLETSTAHRYYYPSILFISLSIILQVAVGIGLILNSRYNVKDDDHMCKADKINNMTVLGIFLITIVNVFVTSFSVASLPPGVSRFSENLEFPFNNDIANITVSNRTGLDFRNN